MSYIGSEPAAKMPGLDANTVETIDIQDGAVTAVKLAAGAAQAPLVSGTNIKTINSTSLLGSGDVAVQALLVSGTSIKTINSIIQIKRVI